MKSKMIKTGVLFVFVMIALNVNAQQGQKNGQGRKEPPSPEKIMERFDTNSDDKITIEELNAHERGDRLAQRFTKIDTNKDGFIDIAELTVHHDKRKEKGGKGQGGNEPRNKPVD